MIPSVRIIGQHQKGPQLLNQWVLVDGFARCIENALVVADISESQKADIKKNNKLVQKSITDLEVYKKAKKISAQEEPELKLVQLNEEEQEIEVDNPKHQQWLDAKGSVETTDKVTLDLSNLREGLNVE